MQTASSHRGREVLVGDVLFGADDIVAEFVRQRMPVARPSFGPCTALGVVKDGVLLGGVVYHNFTGFNIEVSLAFDSPRWLSRKTLRALFSYPFTQLHCARLTCLAGRKNKKSRRLIEGCGWKLEGVHPKALDGVADAMSYGMLREDCKWIKERASTTSDLA